MYLLNNLPNHRKPLIAQDADALGSAGADAVTEILRLRGGDTPTPLHDLPGLAKSLGLSALYIKDEGYVNVDVVKSLVNAGVISWIKYAVVREDPTKDNLLEALVNEVPREIIVSGIGEQPAIIHWRQFGVQSYTAGCVCVAPNRSQEMLVALQAGDFAKADSLRLGFTKLEDLRNAHGPIQVLHHAVKLAGIAETGPLLPLLTDLDSTKQAAIESAAKDLLAWAKA